MNIYLISYGDYDYDGRLRELYRIFSQIGTLYSITRGRTAQGKRHRLYDGNYWGFIGAVKKYAKELPVIDVLVMDNRKAVIPGLLIKRALQPHHTIIDCRELYLMKDVHHLSGKIGCFFERFGIRSADTIICANKTRADFMRKYYHLKATPLVYENLRELSYSGEQARDAQVQRFSTAIRDDEIRILSTSGCSISRTNDVLVKNLPRVQGKCRLFLAGTSSEADRMEIERIIDTLGLDNVELVGNLDQDGLKYLISVCHIGIVNYHQKDTNNTYCASGKIYEYLYEGIPVVTTTNPPLKQLCDENGIGVADDSYADGINYIMQNYEMFCKKVQQFAVNHTVAENNQTLIQQLQVRIHKDDFSSNFVIKEDR